MKTVDKALTVLDQFSVETREIGLSELARKSGLDKAATRRLLVALSEHGFVEQNTQTRSYRLGHGFLRLARIREATVPLEKASKETARWLCSVSQETVHISIPNAQAMVALAHHLPNRSYVVNITPSQPILYHATSSGLAFLSSVSDARRDQLLSLDRPQITPATLVKKKDLMRALKEVRAQGYSKTQDSFEDGVSSLAMVFGSTGQDPIGTIALAMVSRDLTSQREAELLPLLKEAVSRLETAVLGLAEVKA